MSGVQEAIDALKVALHEKGVQHHTRESFDHLASCLVLLNSSSPSVQMIQKLCSVLHKALLPLYNTRFQPTLRLSSSILSTVLGRVCDNVEDDELRVAWDETAKIILSGVLDFLDQEDGGNVDTDCAVWEVLCRTICNFFFLDSGRAPPEFSIRLYLSAYNTLTETAARQANIRNALRDKAVLGGRQLGAAMSRTRDYLLLEALLTLFARLLPPIHKSPQGKARRAKFAKEVLGSSKLFKCNEKLLDIINKTSGTQWDDVAARIVDVLAQCDITYPQPFSIDEIAVCGRVFPQPLATDRLLVDKQAFLVNIIAENDDTCESLQVPYSSIRTITIDTSGRDIPKGKASITIHLTSPPIIADLEMESPDGSQLRAIFLLQNGAVSRFMEALRRRGVGKLNFLDPPARVKRQRESISIGSGFKFTNNSSPVPPTASFEGKVHHVNQVYKTNVEESAAPKPVSTPCIGGSPATGPKPQVLRDERLIPEVQPAVTKDVPATTKVGLISPLDSTSEPVQEPGLPYPGDDSMQPFGDGSELSEISEFESENDMAVGRMATALSAFREHRFKSTRHRTRRTRMNGSSITSPAMGLEKAFILQTSHAAGTVQQPLENGKPLLISDSPIFGSSPTQIDGSPKPHPNAETLTKTSVERVSRLSITSPDFVGTNVSDRNHATDLAVTSARKGITSAEIRLRVPEHSGSSSSSADCQKVHPGPNTEIASLSSTPPKIAGGRRKREIINPSSRAVIDPDDTLTPPRKKSRSIKDKEDNVRPDENTLYADSISRMKKHTKMNGRSIDPTIMLYDECSIPVPVHQETRRSSRIKKRQLAATGGTRGGVTYGNAERPRKSDGQSTRMKSSAGPPQDIKVKKLESPSVKIDSHVTLVELKSVKNITPDAGISQEIPEAVTTREPTQLSVTPIREPRRNLESNQKTVSDEMQFVQPQFDIESVAIADDRQVLCDFHAMDSTGQDNEATPYSPSSGRREHTSESVLQCTLAPEPVTIDLTLSSSPDRERSRSHKASVRALAHPEAGLQSKFTGTCDQHVSLKESPIILSFRHRRRSVTFASPIEHVLEKKFKPKKPVDSSSHRFSPSPKSDSLSPFVIPSGTVRQRRGSPNRAMPQLTLERAKSLQGHKVSVNDRIPGEVGIQDIVEVLNEIQAVIIKGISDRFKNVRKDVQQGREGLIRQVLDELRCLVVENEKYLNELAHLEEDYYKSGKAITRCWEELIDFNDVAVTRSQNALKVYDQNTSARTFPKSLLSLKPAFRHHKASA